MNEYNKIDAVFSQEDSQNPPSNEPLTITPHDNIICIAVEHENKVRTIETELKNFVASAYPLNILITYISSTEKRGYWIFDNPQYQNYFKSPQGRLLVIIDKDMNESWNVWKYNRRETIKLGIFLS